MLELDYAFLAEYATVKDGSLTTVGGSYTHVVVDALPTDHLLSLAGRVRASEDVEPFKVSLTIEAPEGAYRIGMDTTLSRSASSRPYDGKVGILFAATTLMPLPSEGLYWVTVMLEDEPVRRLGFSVAAR